MSNDDWMKIRQIFMPYANRRYAEISHSNTRFAYYTSAQTAFEMIENKKFWLRHTSVMNDFSEGEHGKTMLRKTLIEGKIGHKFKQTLAQVSPSLCVNWDEFVHRVLEQDCDSNYIMSLSEHGEGAKAEKTFGRLSMWRAYGGDTNVALIFNSQHFLQSYFKNLYLSPVLYGETGKVTEQIDGVIRSIEGEIAFLRGQLAEFLAFHLRAMIESSVSSIKHSGFSEEREWRLIFNDMNDPVPDIKYELKVINGIPQKIFMIPLITDVEGVSRDLFAESLEQIIIGPTQYPRVIKDALKAKLRENGAHHAHVTTSDIPLRR